MLISMTGYGKAEKNLQSKKITCEIRSINSKALDVNMKTPGSFASKEMEIRSLLSKKLERGKLEFTLSIQNTDNNKGAKLNSSVVKGYYKELVRLSAQLHNKGTTDHFALALKMPGAISGESKENDKIDWMATLPIINKAIGELNKFRTAEGNSINRDITKRLALIIKLINKIRPLEKRRSKLIQQRIKNKLINGAKEKIDQNRFEQEMIYYLEKVDITEEIVRLNSHCDYFKITMNENKPNGKKMLFIIQEIGREVNTIGAKANDAPIQKIVVEIKDETEKIKEQLFNVL